MYNFGVVLLDILSGKLAFYDKMRLSQGFSANKLILDAHLEGQCSEDMATKALNLAIDCLSMEPKSRPSMNEVVQVLEQLI